MSSGYTVTFAETSAMALSFTVAGFPKASRAMVASTFVTQSGLKLPISARIVFVLLVNGGGLSNCFVKIMNALSGLKRSIPAVDLYF